MQLQFVTVDVFTDRQFGGNPLAVVLNAEDLSDGQMQAIAAEFNLAETTFVLPPEDIRNTARVRIFTPRAEMPFAGHPNVGTAFVLAREGRACRRPVQGSTLLFEEIAGLVRMELIGDAASARGCPPFSAAAAHNRRRDQHQDRSRGVQSFGDRHRNAQPSSLHCELRRTVRSG